MCGNLHIHCMCRFPRPVHTQNVKKKCIDTMHYLYVLVSEREGEKRLVFVSKKISVFTNDLLLKSCYP